MLFFFYISVDLPERDNMILMCDEEKMTKEILVFFELLKFLQHPKLNQFDHYIKQIKGYDSFFNIMKDLDLEEFCEIPKKRNFLQ